MPRTSLAIPDLSLRETFLDKQSVQKQNFTIVGSPTISNGISGFSAANYVTMPSSIILHRTHYSVSLDIELPATFQTATTKILDGGANWSLEGNSGTNVITLNYDVGGAGQTVTLDVTSLMATRTRITFSVYESGANIVADLYAGSLNSTASDAGVMTNLPTSINIGSDAGVNFFNGTIYEIQYYDNIIAEEDHDKLLAYALSSDISPNKSIIFLPGDAEYTNTSGDKVTPVLGTAGVTEAVLGDGTTSITFPTLGPDRMWDFDGGDYINLGDDDDFTLNTAGPFTIGVCASFDDTTATYTVLSKASALTVGEFNIYLSSGSIRIIFLDATLGGYRLIRSAPLSDWMTDNVYCFIVTYDGSGTLDTSTVKIYRNSIDITNTLITSGSFTNIRNTANNLTLGSLSTPGTYLTGKSSLPFILDRELSPLQVRMMEQRMRSWQGI